MTLCAQIISLHNRQLIPIRNAQSGLYRARTGYGQFVVKNENLDALCAYKFPRESATVTNYENVYQPGQVVMNDSQLEFYTHLLSDEHIKIGYTSGDVDRIFAEMKK